MDRRQEEEIIQAALAIATLCAVLASWPALLTILRAWRSPAQVRLARIHHYLIPGALFLALGIVLHYYWFRVNSGSAERLLYTATKHGHLTSRHSQFDWESFRVQSLHIFLPLWFSGLGGALLVSPLVARIRRPAFVITTREFRVRVKDFSKVKKAFQDRYRLPIGVDLRTGKVLTLSQRRRTSHVIMLGATGTGKSTFLVNALLHAIRHNQPCLFIDPKGEEATLRLVQEMGRRLSPDFDQRFKLFKLANPAQSCHYNPLKHGNSGQIKDRVLEALNWSEQYYQSLAGDFLTLMTASCERLGQSLSLDVVSRILSEKTEQAKLLSKLKASVGPSDERGRDLYRRMAALSERMKPEDLLGLQAQLSILNSPSLGPLLTSEFAKRDQEIDLRQVLAKNQCAYFQLGTLGNADTARRIGRMIVEDLKGLASHIYQSVPDENHRKFFPVFLDEFGSFASKEFIEALKQMRGARIAVHLFAQGFEDLDIVSPEFRRQSGANPLTKVSGRVDDNKTVEEICGMAGTVESLEQSYQVEGRFLRSRTGMGNLRESRKMRVEHDVFKNLNVGQAVVIEKNPSRVSPIQFYHPSVLLSP